MKNFFVKAGRPSKEEKILADKIQSILIKAEEEGNKELLSAIESQGAVYNLDGLKKLHDIVTKGKNNSNNNTTTMGKLNENSGKEENTSSGGDGLNAEEVKFEEVPNIAEESQFQQPPVERENAYEKYANSGSSGNGGGGEAGGEGEGGGEDGAGGGEGEEEFEEPRDSGEGEDFTASGGTGNLKDLPPDTKRKAIKKTSEIVAKIYAGALPILPKLMSKIPEAKLERMSWNDEIDLSMRLELPDGSKTNVGSYIRVYNQQLDDELVISPEQQKDFQDCLKDVLEEKQVAMTPMQRLIATGSAHLFTMVAVSIQNMVMMKKNLDYWKEVHEENKRKSRPQQPPAGGANKGGNNDFTPPPPPPPPTPAPDDKPSSNGQSEVHGNTESEPQVENEELSINPEDAEVK